MCREREQLCVAELLNCCSRISQQKRREIGAKHKCVFSNLYSQGLMLLTFIYIAVLSLTVAA